MISLLKKELDILTATYSIYFFMIVYLVACSIFLWVIPEGINVFDNVYANLESFFILSSWMFLWLIPAICMRQIAEEKRSGTFELLLSRPFSIFSIVVSKFLAVCIIIFVSLVPTLLFVYTVHQLSEPIGNIDGGVIISSYIGLILLTFVFISISLFSSAISNNQVIAFILGSCLCFLFYIGFEYLATLATIKFLQQLFHNLSIREYFLNFLRGLLDSRDIIFFFSIIIIFLLGTAFKIKSFQK